jgi:hypothetical protein
MPLQNRVDPWGEIHAVDARGLFMGNRGVIHDPGTKTLLTRKSTTKAWIICECRFKGRKREVMGRNTPSGNAGWTELFFLDEVTALSAGHRPCFECRREKAKEYADCFGKAFGIARPKVADIDERLEAERGIHAGSVGVPPGAKLKDYPDGTMMMQGERFFAKRRKVLRGWNFWHYSDEFDLLDLAMFDVWQVTPQTTVEVLRAGYQPVWHPSILGDHGIPAPDPRFR